MAQQRESCAPKFDRTSRHDSHAAYRLSIARVAGSRLCFGVFIEHANPQTLVAPRIIDALVCAAELVVQLRSIYILKCGLLIARIERVFTTRRR